jgi:hypothetical protein
VQAPELLRRLSLQFNPQKRISAEDFYAHPYLGGNRHDLLELAGGAAQVASTLQEHQALQLEAKVLTKFELEALITQACARVLQRRAQAGQQWNKLMLSCLGAVHAKFIYCSWSVAAGMTSLVNWSTDSWNVC